LALWVASLMKCPDLIDDFYKFERSEEKAGKLGVKNAEQFFIAGLYCYKNFRVRDEISNTLLLIASKIRDN